MTRLGNNSISEENEVNLYMSDKTHITKVSSPDNMRFSDFKDFLFNVGGLISKGDNGLLSTHLH